MDDAVGEAFDKIAKMMGMPYPGGPLIDKYAQVGDATRFSFPRTKVEGLDFSFSGIKTAFLYFLRKHAKDPSFIEKHRSDICASIQATLVGMLMQKLRFAVAQTGIRCIAVGGGVANNSALRKRLLQAEGEDGWKVFIPRGYCADNAAMVAMAGHFFFQKSKKRYGYVVPMPNMPF